MEAYKAFNGDLTCTKGKGTYQYEPGKTYYEEESKTASTGFHCCENSLDCLSWYGLPLGTDHSRIFRVEAAGDIDEIEDKIACTEITLTKELDLRALTIEVVKFLIYHPLREWQRRGHLYEVQEDSAEAKKDGFAIARGHRPVVRGEAGSCVGVLVEHLADEFKDAKVGMVGRELEPDTWYTVQDNRWVVAEHEEKAY